MKRAMMVFLVVCVGFGSAQAQLKVDFSQTGSPVQDGYQGYLADHEVAATFTTQTYSAFGSTVSVTATWASDAVNTVMQMIDRGAGAAGYSTAPADMDDFMRDWIGSDTRSAGDPLTLTISGLPKGTYGWFSYHHDTDGPASMGLFDVTVNDAAGSTTTTDIPITGREDTTTIDGAATFETTIVSNGDDVTIVFDTQPYTNEYNEAWFLMNGFELEMLSALDTAHGPSPSEGLTDVPADVVLSWMPGESAVTHNVYLGTNFDDVNDATATNDLGVLVSSGQTATAYDPASRLEFGQTYYWRVDEVEAGNTVVKGGVWSFTTEPLYYMVKDIMVTASLPTAAGSGDPEAIVDGNGLTDGLHDIANGTMWSAKAAEGDAVWLQFDFNRPYKLYGMHVWNHNSQFEYALGFGFKDITIEYATEPNEWVTLGDYELARASGLATYAGERIDVDGVAARSIRINVASTHGGREDAGLSEIQFLYKPVAAREPEPADGETGVDFDASLSWRAGREAVSHEVHWSTDSDAVAEDAALLDTVTVNTYDLPMLDLGTTYYWKIVEVNDAETSTSWASDIWSFSTPAYLVVDDFEAYTDAEGEEIFNVWADGYGDNFTTNGCQVGYDAPPYMESTIVHSGGQAMPFLYGNNNTTTSEATLSLSGADWTVAGATTLTLYFYGEITNAPADLYVEINGTKINYSDSSALTKPWWTQWNIDLASIPGGATAVDTLVIGTSGSGAGLLLIDDIRLYKTVSAAATEQVWVEAESATALPAPWTTMADEPLASGGQYIVVPSTATSSTDGPSTADVATYEFTVAGGQYRLWFRLGPIIDYDTDSFWVRIPTATSLDPVGNAANPGWVRFNGLAGQAGADAWHWGPVWDDEHGSEQVTFTLPAGTHTLEVSYRELQAPLDLILITNDLTQ